MDYQRLAKPDIKVGTWRDYLLALLAGVLMALSFPKPDFSVLAWFAFVPLLLAIARKSPAQAFRLGMVCGLTAYGGLLYWLNIVMTLYGNLPAIVSFCLFLLLTAYLALYVGIIARLVRRGEIAGISPLLSFPCLWVGFEYLRSFALTGFPWASLGYTQYRILPLIQIADITGVYGLSFLIALANVVLLRIIKGAVMRGHSVYPAKSAALLLLLLVMTLGYGFMRLNSVEHGIPLKIALIQGNISQDVKWDPAFQESTVAVYEKLTRLACAGGSDLVVWPESAAPFYFQDSDRYTSRIKRLAANVKSYLVVGSPAYDIDGGNVKYRNSAYLLSETGEVLGRSDKIHLVPFGEYVPLAKFLPFVHKLVVGIGDFSPGTATVPLSIGKGKIGILICFEGIFPELSRGYVKAGSRLLVNITNDAWYGRSSAPYQHLSMTVFRAVENRVPLVRAANTGITAIIDSRGHIRGMTQLFKEAYLTGEVRLGDRETIYTRYGDIFAGLCLALSAVIIVLAYRKKRGR
ncbi:MAG TPA: apolipoprotein N-acyltransferase [Geobacteraceae bacterium]|nr:apolipoprotein N-acyltransferase [Geobacteraceae bacterium]